MGIWSTRRLRNTLKSMPLPPPPFTVEGLAANMSALSGRRIELCQIDEQDIDLRTACGLRARVGEVTIIFYRDRPTEHQRTHIVMHELMHELLDHGTTLTAQQLRSLVPPPLMLTLTERAAPGAVIQARARYETAEEREAELAASLLKDLVRAQVGDERTDLVSLLEHTLSHPVAPMRRPKKTNTRRTP